MSDDAEDEREVELSTLAAIYPEIRLDTQDQFTISIQLPVKPTFKVPIYFPDPSDGLPEQAAVLPTEPNEEKDIHYIEHLPPLDLRITLPFGYPTKLPPVVEVSTSPLWLSQSVLDRLRADNERLWEELGHDQTVYAYIDQVQQDAENAFGVLQENEYLDIPLEYKIGILDFDIEARKAAFNKETFYCGICLGKLHKLLDV
jgi:E3 ubiquitin-protein ligase RNF14